MSLVARLCSGAVFGAALTASGVYSPSVIISQMRLQDFHMLQAFLTASAVSAILMVGARKVGLAQCTPRSPSTLGLFHRYDGNILGGVILGFGMTLSGACPGTVLVQIATGIRSGYFALIGGLLGGGAYTQLAPYLRKPAETKEEPRTALTVYQYFDVDEYRGLFAYEALCFGVVLLAASLGARTANVLVGPIIGGLLISGGQAASLALAKNPVGVSAAYDQLVQLLRWKWGNTPKSNEPMPAIGSIAFAAGIVAGALTLSRLFPAPVPGGEVLISVSRALLGGFAMVFGARVAGGCTSGHGISGMSTLSISSFVTVASIFGGGIALMGIL